MQNQTCTFRIYIFEKRQIIPVIKTLNFFIIFTIYVYVNLPYNPPAHHKTFEKRQLLIFLANAYWEIKVFNGHTTRFEKITAMWHRLRFYWHLNSVQVKLGVHKVDLSSSSKKINNIFLQSLYQLWAGLWLLEWDRRTRPSLKVSQFLFLLYVFIY